MYLHLGRDYVLNDRDVIGIFNLETTTISPRGREFLNYAQKHGAVVSLSDELPQSYVLADAPVGHGLSFGAVPRRAETACGTAPARGRGSHPGKKMIIQIVINTRSGCSCVFSLV